MVEKSMRDGIEQYRDKIELEYNLACRGGTLTVRGTVRNKGEKTVHVTELKALYKNFDGFTTEVDSLTCDWEVPPEGTRTFAFPERDRPVNLSTGEVVVSKASKD